MRYIAGADVGGTKIALSIANEYGFVARLRQPVKLEGDERTVPRQIDFMIDYGCRRIGAKNVDALGIGAPGPFRLVKAGKRTYKRIVAGNLCGALGDMVLPNNWREIPLEEALSPNYRKVVVQNDATAAANAEWLFGETRGQDTVLITIGTGLGGGARVSGTDEKGRMRSVLLTGKDGNAVEPCYMVCGQTFLEDLVSGRAIESGFGDTAKAAFAAYRKGDQRARAVIGKAADDLAKGLASISALLGNHVFVIGGSVFTENQDILASLVRRKIGKYRHPSLTETMGDVEIYPSALGKYSGDMGSLSLVMPEEWTKKWRARKPWQGDIKTIEIT